MEVISAKDMGTDADKTVVLQDGQGRIMVGSSSLLVFDGHTWRAYPKPNAYSLLSLSPGNPGILWATTVGDLGFFREDHPGNFEFHSLLDKLPPDERELGPVWGCAPVGGATYFICKDRLLRWDGQSFRVTPFRTSRRLSVLRLGKEHWIHHLESGLYKLTEAGPELQVTADQLPGLLIMGLFRDEQGLVTVSNEGLRRPGQSGAFSSDELKKYLTENKVSAFLELPEDKLAIGTLYGGLVLTNRAGQPIRTWADSNVGLPGRGIIGLAADEDGRVLGTTPTDFFAFPASGAATLFQARNGLRGQAVTHLLTAGTGLYAMTDDGTYQLVPREGESAEFTAVPELSARYHQAIAYESGMLLTRFGGVDWFDGTTTRAAYTISADSAIHITPMRAQPRSFYVCEGSGIVRLTQKPDGNFERTPMLTLPDIANSLHEDAAGGLWIGTSLQGAFHYDSTGNTRSEVKDPATGRPIEGDVQIIGDDERILFFLHGRTLVAGPRGENLQELTGIPAVTPAVVQARHGTREVFVAYERHNIVSGPLHGAGLLTFAADGKSAWRELALPSLDTIGSIRTALFVTEGGKPVLWLGGMAGVLRLDFDQIKTLPPPTAPAIALAAVAGETVDGVPVFPHKNHQIRFQIHTGSYFPSRHWVFQTRLGDGTGGWSPPGAAREYEYTNLSEGLYAFEVRAVNTAGVPGPAAVFSFRVLPPWYRSGSAYAGYAAALLLAVFGFIRMRERNIRARNQELEKLVGLRTAELVKANAAKDEFLAGISHEIRNPMNGVIGLAESFRTDGLDPENRRKFSLLRQCASHLSSLLEDILDFSKVQAGAIELDPKPFDLPELVESVAGITRADSEKYGIPVETAVSPAVPARLLGDARRVRQILINFVSNALKFSGRGQVSVTVWCKEAGPGKTEVIFAVSDEGPGIAPDEQARLFTRFERGAAAQKGRVPGTGLGLALCKGLAEKMGGRIWLESELGRGSCFYFSAPFPIVDGAAAAANPVRPVAAPGRAALIVDDQEYNRIVLTDLLQSMDFAVESAQEGQAALDAAARRAFDVVFLDFNLPGMSGVDVARRLRGLPGPSAHALILATTAFDTPEKRAQCLDAGMDAFLGKPVTRERLTKALRALAPVDAPTDGAEPPKPAPADPLGNLRLLARKKGVPLAAELATYFAELDAELAALDAALAAENADDAGRCSHMLCGRCSFIYESALEQSQRRVEAAIADLHWAEARRHREEFGRLLAAARVRLQSSAQAAPPA
jgi:signal transduction histidine kinase/CheY-like chemotaxis protein